ncbi:PREDICTED: uncharacterized protein LOC105557594 isoform X1 [Vollenhovia emeryi]|uniref:uncharacterized protein LOC105557594 isoform X1 n=1 Tax=Vollenhovia emeryi TaxID=411798 RepID=UPI0005F37CBB|nr:PREDICTED: uncharacterized protein LOC105557594 isoform X1 [Vollenhovia emeryi]
MEIDPMYLTDSTLPEDTQVNDDEDGAADLANDGMDKRAALLRRELENSRKEQELARKELELAKREIELLQNMRQISVNSCNETLEENPQVNPIAVVRESRLTNNDDLTKVMMGSRLKGKALEWLHSRSEYIAMPVNDLLGKLREMFYHRPSKILTRRQFEQRTWKREETFSSYLHDKVILADRVPIEDDEIIEYIIEGIPDQMLRNQARVQRLKSQESLLEAFDKVSLRGRGHHTGTYPKNEEKLKQQKTGKKTGKGEAAKITKRCHNCGLLTHYATDCPMKSKGRKCFKCQEFGHIAAECKKK